MGLYTVNIPYTEFQANFCEEYNDGEGMGTAKFNKFVYDDGSIDIEYTYGDCSNGLSTINWRVADDKTVYTTKYGGSSTFAMWWCGVSDDAEEEQDKAALEELKETIDGLIKRMQKREWNLPDEKYKAMMGAMEGLTKMFGVVEVK